MLQEMKLHLKLFTQEASTRKWEKPGPLGAE